MLRSAGLSATDWLRRETRSETSYRECESSRESDRGDGTRKQKIVANETLTVIRPASGWLEVDLGSIWRYRDLIYLMVRRDFVAQYAQTILGPLWIVIQPLLTTVMFSLVFGRVARLPTDGMPPMLFYMTGVVSWSYFAVCVTRTSATFSANAHVFGKVWFPRLTVPISIVLSALFAFAIQLVLLGAVLGWEIAQGTLPGLGERFWAVPLLVLQMGVLGLACGIIVSSLTTQYRDLANLVAFGVQLWMYASPVVYPASRIPDRWAWIMFVNPMAPVIEAFRVALVGVGTVSPKQLGASLVVTFATLAVGVILFNRIEKSFMDTV